MVIEIYSFIYFNLKWMIFGQPTFFHITVSFEKNIVKNIQGGKWPHGVKCKSIDYTMLIYDGLN